MYDIEYTDQLSGARITLGLRLGAVEALKSAAAFNASPNNARLRFPYNAQAVPA